MKPNENDDQQPSDRSHAPDHPKPKGRGAVTSEAAGTAGVADGGGFAPGFAALIERLNATNDELLHQVDELSRRNREFTLFSRMNEILQSGSSENDAYAVISDVASRLFPDDSGAVFMAQATQEMLVAAAAWGPRPLLSRSIRLQECVAHRAGSDTGTAFAERSCGPECPNALDGCPMHACIPLLAHEQTVGILHLIDESHGGSEAAEAHHALKRGAAQRLADNVALAIFNLRSREALRNLSIRDGLTGLYNRRYMDEALANEQRRTARNKDQLAVIMIDIDDFRRFNDNFGHDAGDAVLRALGEVFRRSARGTDIACRYGGEEFVLILSPSNAAGARHRAERLREEVRSLAVRHAGRDLAGITLSLGVAVYPGQASDADTLLKAADVALYQAKHAGRDRVVMFDQLTAPAALAVSTVSTMTGRDDVAPAGGDPVLP